MDETSRTPKEVARRDPFRAHVYGEVWGVLGELQPGGPTARERTWRWARMTQRVLATPCRLQGIANRPSAIPVSTLRSPRARCIAVGRWPLTPRW